MKYEYRNASIASDNGDGNSKLDPYYATGSCAAENVAVAERSQRDTDANEALA